MKPTKPIVPPRSGIATTGIKILERFKQEQMEELKYASPTELRRLINISNFPKTEEDEDLWERVLERRYKLWSAWKILVDSLGEEEMKDLEYIYKEM